MKKTIASLWVLLLLSSCTAQSGSSSTTTNPDKKSFLAKSTGKLPALLYGLGDDRLGGAKMGYIDTNILFKVIDTTVAPWKVQLSNYRTAYIDKQYIKPDTSLREKPFYLTSNFKATGSDSDNYDILSVAIDEKLPYRSWMQTEPSAIQIELFGVQSNTNWIMQQISTLKEIKNVYYRQSEADVILVTIELQHKNFWGYSMYYQGNNLVIKVKQQPAVLDVRKLKIAIDPGHGGTNLGAAGNTTHILEKNYTLLFSKELKKYLNTKGIQDVVLTRDADTSLDMKDRIIFGQQQNPDLLISIHLNSNGDPAIKGSGTFYRHIGFRPVSLHILKAMQDIGMDEYSNVGNFNFGLSGPTDFVNCLLEVGFLSNRQDELKLASVAFHKQTASAIYKALVNWLKEIKDGD